MANWVKAFILVAFLAVGAYLYRLNRLYSKMVIQSGLAGVSFEGKSIVFSTDTNIKNPTGTSLSILPPFVTVFLNDKLLASSNIPKGAKAQEIAATAETVVESDLSLSILDLLTSAPALFKGKTKIKILTFIRWGPFGMFSSTTEDVVDLPQLKFPI